MEDRRLLRLVKKACRGDQEAFREIIELNGRRILYTATKLLGNTNDAEDAAQEAVIKIGHALPKLRKPELFSSWMYRIVYTVCMDARKAKAKDPQELVELESAMETISDTSTEVLPERFLEDEATREIFLSIIDTLPERYRMCLVFFYYDDLTYPEIASVMQVNEQTVGALLTRARAKLREELAKTEEGSRLAGLKKPSGVLPAAAITQAMTLEEQKVVTTHMMEKLMAAASVSAASLAGKTVLVSAITTLISSGIAKTAAVVVVGLAAVGVGIALNSGSAETESNGSTLPPAVAPITVPENNPTTEAPPEVVQTRGLDSFTNGTSSSDWEDFVEAGGLKYNHHIVGADYRYTLYTYHDRDTGIDTAVIARADRQGNTQIASKNLSEVGTLPDGIGLVGAFEGWGS